MIKPTILTIGTSDNLGSAGIQADLVTFANFGCYGANAIVCITAQKYNNKDLIIKDFVSVECIEKQIEYAMQDLNIKTIKISMLPSIEIITSIANIVDKYKNKLDNIIVDPVLTNSNKELIFSKEIVQEIKLKIIPLATVITPNIIELEAIFNIRVDQNYDISQLKSVLPCMAIIKCGNVFNNNLMADCCFDQKQILILQKSKLLNTNIRGDGCVLSAVIASSLALGKNFINASILAKDYVWNLIKGKKIISLME